MEEQQERDDAEQPQLYMQPPIPERRLSDSEKTSDSDETNYLKEKMKWI